MACLPISPPGPCNLFDFTHYRFATIAIDLNLKRG
jgi:hypothetical protein